MEIIISTAKTSKTSKWKNQKIDWRELAQKLIVPVRTSETYAEYIRLSKDEQGIIKDVGGFVGGHLKDGKRSIHNVSNRQLITLDLDFAPLNLWEEFKALFDCEAVIYTTHKHSEKTPRYRLIIPLDKEVDPLKYEAISRKVAELIDMEYFDAPSFETLAQYIKRLG